MVTVTGNARELTKDTDDPCERTETQYMVPALNALRVVEQTGGIDAEHDADAMVILDATDQVGFEMVES